MDMRNTNASQGRIGSLVVSALFFVAGLVTLYDTAGYMDRDSQVFPRTVAVLLIATSGIAFLREFLRPGAEEGFGSGSWWRRCLLVASMLAACLAMPVIGFLPAGAIAFAGGLIAAMHDRWTMRRLVLYSGSGIVVMAGFFVLFKYVLLVPLP